MPVMEVRVCKGLQTKTEVHYSAVITAEELEWDGLDERKCCKTEEMIFTDASHSV